MLFTYACLFTFSSIKCVFQSAGCQLHAALCMQVKESCAAVLHKQVCGAGNVKQSFATHLS